jgi:hypothetical protein
MAKLYDIAEDLLSLNDLMESLVDENGEPREPTEEEMQEMRKWFELHRKSFKTSLTHTVSLSRT